jgi:hypothetical protein
MRFSVTRDFDADAAAVAAVLLDPAFQGSLALPDLALPETVESSAHKLVLRYAYVGSIDPIVKKILGSRRLTWLQTIDLDPAMQTGVLSINAEAAPDRLTANATIAITPRAPAQTTLTIEGELRVHLPLVGGSAEKRLVPGVVARLEVEADAITQHLASSP